MPFSKLIPSATTDTIKTLPLSERLSDISALSLQEVLQYSIKGLIETAINICIAVALFVVGRWLIRRVYHLFNSIFTRRNVDLSLRTFLLSLINITLTAFLLIAIIGVLGINTTSFVALFASAGVAIGMALSGTLQNFAGGVMILLFKPYKVNDFIEAQGQLGTVKEIQIFSTILNTPDNKTIIIPNGGLATGIINNYSKEGFRRVDWTFGVGYGTDYEFAKQTIAELLKKDHRISTDHDQFIALHSLGDSSINIVVRVWTQVEDYWPVYFLLNERVYKTFSEVGINIPYPQMDVHLRTPKV